MCVTCQGCPALASRSSLHPPTGSSWLCRDMKGFEATTEPRQDKVYLGLRSRQDWVRFFAFGSVHNYLCLVLEERADVASLIIFCFVLSDFAWSHCQSWSLPLFLFSPVCDMDLIYCCYKKRYHSPCYWTHAGQRP